ncbi:MAG: hypothetical protein AB3N21_18040 [Ruegeria sp.]|uniref:hypothetical protein n=1 Tax=Ruegeria sp. TaxID=1879320 RepID=UPI00349EA015
MHRKFIALIVSTAIAITGLSASQARAADPHDILGGLAAIAILGAAIHHYDKKRDRERARHDYRIRDYPDPGPVTRRPLPPRVARYDLPQRCLRTFKRYSRHHPLLGQKCLKRHYRHANSLPKSCKVGFWNGERVRKAYEPRCLRQHGYRVVGGY